MASNVHKQIPSDPEKVMIMRNITPDILTCTVPFLRVGRIKIGGRGTVVRMAYQVLKEAQTAFNESVARINAWDFDKVIPCHGEVIEKDGKGIFEKVIEWHLNAAKKSG